MGQVQKDTHKQLTALWKNKKVKVLPTKDKKYVIFSDFHLGNGGAADDFHENEDALIMGLRDYYKNGYTLILLGDVEELWQFDLDEIVKKYNNTVYKEINKFGVARIYRIFGNHDREFGGVVDPIKFKSGSTGTAIEALKMKDASGIVKMLLVHGHQGSTESDKNTWSSRFFVRTFRAVEPIAKFLGLYGEGSATKSQIPSDYERILYNWAKRNKVILLCGHSHRAIFASKSYTDRLQDQIYDLQYEIQQSKDNEKKIKKLLEKITEKNKDMAYEGSKGRAIDPTEKNRRPKPCYFNTGCGLYTDGVTAIEIDNDEIRLVKWNKKNKDVWEEDSLSQLISEL